MGTTRTVLLELRPTAPEVQALIDGPFDVAWFEDTNHWSVSAGTAHVYMDYDPHNEKDFEEFLSESEQAAVLASLGTKPGLALHLYVSVFTPGSAELADEVARHILGRWRGVVSPVERAG